MKKSFLSSKIHKATVTDSQLDYEGSCEIDVSLLNAAGISVMKKLIYIISRMVNALLHMQLKAKQKQEIFV